MATSCSNKADLEKEFTDLTEKLNVLKKEYQKLLVENFQKDLIIWQLKTENKQKKFVQFEKSLSKVCIEKLNLIGDAVRDDSQFIGLVLPELYKGDTETISNLSLAKKKKKKSDTNIEIKKETKEILQNILTERLSYITGVDEKRKSNLNKLIRNCIDNAKRTKKINKSAIPTSSVDTAAST